MKKKSLKINALLNGFRQICTIVFPLITIPYVSRVLGNENYGKVNFGSSIVSYFILMATLGITSYAIREGSKLKNQRDKFENFVNEIFTINIITTIASYVLLVIMLLFWEKVQNYQALIMIQASVMIFTTLGLGWLNNIYEDFAYTTIRYIVVQVISIVLLFLLVKDKNDYLMYAVITAFANIGGNIVNIFYIRKNYLKVKLVKVSNFFTHFIPMIYLFCNDLAITIYVSSDVTLLTLFKGDEITGIYSISTKIYTIIKQFMNAVIGVILPRLSLYVGENRMEEYNNLLNKLFHVIMILILPSMVGIYMLSKEIIYIIAGQEFVSGYVSLQILGIALGLAVMSFFFVTSIMIVNKLEKYCLVSTLIAALINIILNFVFIPKWSLNGAAMTTVISESVVLGLSIWFSRGRYKLDISLKKFLPCILSCIGIIGVCLVVKYFIVNEILIVAASIIGSLFIYALVMSVMKDEIVYNTEKAMLGRIIK